MEIRRYKNGNFAVKREPEYDLPLNDSDFGNGLNLIGDLVNSGELDFTIAGESGCAGNYAMYHPLYNAYTGLLYLPTDYDCSDYAAGKWVHLYGRPLDENDIESMTTEEIIPAEQISRYEVWQLDCLYYGDQWCVNNQMRLGEIVFIETNLRSDILRTFRDQLNIQLDARRVLVVEENDTLEIHARKDRLPLFALRVVT